MRDESTSCIRLNSQGAECSFWFASPYVLLSRFEGHVDAATAKWIVDTLDALTAPLGEFHFFNDAEGLNSYDSSLRLMMVEWVKRSRPRLVANHVLVRSKVVAMGITVARVVLGDVLRMHNARGTFERALAQLDAGS